MVDITLKKRKWVVVSSIAKIYNAQNSSCHSTLCYSNARLGVATVASIGALILIVIH